MITNFQKKFGIYQTARQKRNEPRPNVIIAFGDYSHKHANSLRFHTPIIRGIGLRRLLRKAGTKYAIHFTTLFS